MSDDAHHNIRAWPELQDLFPPLSTAERDALEASIADHGVQVPILVLEDGRIVDGYHRWILSNGEAPIEILHDLSEQEALMLGISLNRDRRQLSPEQRTELAINVRKLGMTQQKAAELAGVARSTVSSWQNTSIVSSDNACIPDLRLSVPKSARPEIYAKVKSGETQAQVAADYKITQQRVSQLIAAQKKKEADAEKRREMLKAEVALPEGVRIVQGDFREATEELPDESVDLIFTDPPYGRDSVEGYEDLAKVGARILKPKGSLIAYVGHYALRQVLWDMGHHLRYWWLLIVKHTGPSARLQGKGVLVEYKPLVWFVKEGREVDSYITDFIYSEPSDKQADDWQQAMYEARYCIEHLSDEGGLVVDTFCGSGTTLLAALEVGRCCWGCDADADKVAIAKARVDQWSNQVDFTTSMNGL